VTGFRSGKSLHMQLQSTIFTMVTCFKAAFHFVALVILNMKRLFVKFLVVWIGFGARSWNVEYGLGIGASDGSFELWQQLSGMRRDCAIRIRQIKRAPLRIDSGTPTMPL
jgi:hypothetical protein